jgi:RimJ/RimL family protein N-acetyltransferase
VQAVFPRWEIVRFLGGHVPWPYPSNGAETYLRERALPGIRQGSQWHWSLRPRTAPERLIGMITLRDKPDDNRGLWLDPAWQGQGLMVEACSAATEYWFETLQRPVLRALKAAANLRSRRISERDGMRLIDTREHDYVSGRLLSEVWEITREEWRKRPPTL